MTQPITQPITQPPPAQQTEGVAARTLWRIALALVAISALLVVIAWLVVEPARPGVAHPAPSVLEHGLFAQARGGAAAEARAQLELARTAWVDRERHIARIPIERAIDAVVADPTLLVPTASDPAGAP